MVAVALIGLVWGGLLAGDWIMRVRWFQWHRSLVQAPSHPSYMGYAVPLSTNHVPAEHGADLAGLVAVESVAERFKVDRPAFTQINDEYGLPNEPPVTPGRFPVVLVGDSYMLQGGDMSNRLAGQVSALLHLPVYTMALAGFGPIAPFSAFLDHPVFSAHPPKVVVWGVLEREIGGIYFEGMLFNVLKRVEPNRGTLSSTNADTRRVLWSELKPDHLRKRLPQTSIAAQLSRRVWAIVRYYVFGKIPPEVAISSHPFHGRDMLFYEGGFRTRCWGPEQRDLPRVTRTITKANNAYFKPRGIEWVILLIPDKETVYEEYVPREVFPCDPVPPSCLTELEERLHAENIHVVNLLPAYREAARQGRLLYWPGDTHWNVEGIAEAARVMQGPLEKILAEKP